MRTTQDAHNLKYPPDVQAQAKTVYRQAWASWCLTKKDAHKHKMERLMDDMQERIAPGPGVVWETFARSIPGFIEYWESWHEESLEEMKELLSQKTP